MKKAFLLVIVLALALGISYLILHKTDSGTDHPDQKDTPLTVNSKSSAFNQSFAGLLNNYYELGDNFVKSDTAGIYGSAVKLSSAIDNIHFDQLKADTAIVETALKSGQVYPRRNKRA